MGYGIGGVLILILVILAYHLLRQAGLTARRISAS